MAEVVAVLIDDQIACITREIGFRERLYPRWVEQKKLTQAAADAELERMRAVLSTLQGIKQGLSYRGELIDGEAAVRRSERLKVLEIVGRNMHSGGYLRVEAAVRRELGA